MNVTVVENTSTAQVTESVSTVLVLESNPTVLVSETSLGVEVAQSRVTATVIETGLTVTVEAPSLAVVEVQSPGPKGDPATVEVGPAFTYSGGLLSRIDYDSGAYKTLTYEAGRLARVDYVRDGDTVRKTLIYDGNGALTEIVQTSF